MYRPFFFVEDEFSRVGCKMSDVNEESLRKLDAARRIAGIPFVITSAFRTSAQNSAANGAKNSAHLRGRAFDIKVSAATRFIVVKSAIDAGFTRIGVSTNFVHMDDDLTLPSPRLWLY